MTRGSFLSEPTLFVKNIIKIFNTLFIQFLKTSQKFHFRFGVDFWVSEEKLHKRINLNFTFRLIPNNLITITWRHLFWINYKAGNDNFTAELINKGTLWYECIVYNSHFKFWNLAEYFNDLVFIEEAVFPCVEYLIEYDWQCLLLCFKLNTIID